MCHSNFLAVYDMLVMNFSSLSKAQFKIYYTTQPQYEMFFKFVHIRWALWTKSQMYMHTHVHVNIHGCIYIYICTVQHGVLFQLSLRADATYTHSGLSFLTVTAISSIFVSASWVAFLIPLTMICGWTLSSMNGLHLFRISPARRTTDVVPSPTYIGNSRLRCVCVCVL